MGQIIILLFVAVIIWLIYLFRRDKRTTSFNSFIRYDLITQAHPFDKKSMKWCSEFLGIENNQLKSILTCSGAFYKKFRLRKRSGGFRKINAPNTILLSIQRTIYQRILQPVNIHPAATGFRHKKSVVDNAAPHLKNKQVLKVDIVDFFGNIKEYTIIKTFENIGYPYNVAKILAHLCCYNKRLPQGAATSPVLSNIVAYNMDVKLEAMAKEHNLVYTRYADDLTFSGQELDKNTILPKIEDIVKSEKFYLKKIKTKFIPENKRKIITGISISSGEKLTIPKVTKREIRKNVHYIITKGLDKHLRHINSTDPAYLKRLIGQLSFWYSVEPDNKYVINSLRTLKRMRERRS